MTECCCHSLRNRGVEGGQFDSSSDDKAPSFAFHAMGRFGNKDQRNAYSIPAGLGRTEEPPKLFPTRLSFAVEGGQENRPLVFECLVDATRGQLHSLRQIDNRGRMVAPLTKEAHRLVERFVDVALARTASASGRCRS